jgi:hypothetical protein
MPDGE